MSKETYEVLEVKGLPGLTVGNRVIPPGGQFTREAWPYPEENLKKVLEKKRCKKITVKDSRPVDEGKEKLEKKIAAMTKAYGKMNPNDPKAQKLLIEIDELKKGD